MLTLSSAQVGKPAPLFQGIAVVDGRLKEISLGSYAEANHWLILVFFPKAWSIICPTEIMAFSTRLDEFLYKRSCAVVFCCTDNEQSLKAWNNTDIPQGGLGGVHVPLISDSSHRISRNYGVLIEEEGVAQRALFIIDPKGCVRNITINDADVGRSVEETLRLLDALKFKDEFGEGCPIDWKKGDKGIDVKTKTNIDGPIEIPRALSSWTNWARPKFQRAWSGTSSPAICANRTPPLGSVDDIDRPLGSLNFRSIGSGTSQSAMVSPAMQAGGASHFEEQLEHAIKTQADSIAAKEKLGDISPGYSVGVAT